jgi:hypothetical protein
MLQQYRWKVNVIHNTKTYEYLASPHEHDRVTTNSPVNVCCPSSDAAGLQAHTDCWQASLSNCDTTHGLRSNVLAHLKQQGGQAMSMKASHFLLNTDEAFSSCQSKTQSVQGQKGHAVKLTAVHAMLLHG